MTSLDLSPRRHEVLHLAACGLTDKEIAARLHLQVRTVRFHFTQCRRVLGARTRPQATAIAAARGLIDPFTKLSQAMPESRSERDEALAFGTAQAGRRSAS